MSHRHYCPDEATCTDRPELNAEMKGGLHSLKHGRWLPRSMAKGLVHFGFARLAGDEYEITDLGLEELDRLGICLIADKP